MRQGSRKALELAGRVGLATAALVLSCTVVRAQATEPTDAIAQRGR